MQNMNQNMFIMNKVYKIIFVISLLSGIAYAFLYELIDYGDTAPLGEPLWLSLKNILSKRESIICRSAIYGSIGLLISCFINVAIYFLCKRYNKN